MKNKPGRPAGTTMDPRFTRNMARFRLVEWLNVILSERGDVGRYIEGLVIKDMNLKTPKF